MTTSQKNSAVGENAKRIIIGTGGSDVEKYINETVKIGIGFVPVVGDAISFGEGIANLSSIKGETIVANSQIKAFDMANYIIAAGVRATVITSEKGVDFQHLYVNKDVLASNIEEYNKSDKRKTPIIDKENGVDLIIKEFESGETTHLKNLVKWAESQPARYGVKGE